MELAQDRLQRLVSSLPNEIKSMIISWMVKVNFTVLSTMDSARVEDWILKNIGHPLLLDSGHSNIRIHLHPLLLFSGDQTLEEVATTEFWNMNTFEAAWTGPYSALNDEPSRQLHVQHLDIYIKSTIEADVIDAEREDEIGTLHPNTLKQAIQAYPQLAKLLVRVDYNIRDEFLASLLAAFHEDSIGVGAWERLHWLKNMIRHVRELREPKSKALLWNAFADEQSLTIGQVVEIDGRGRTLMELVWEVLEYPQVMIQL